MGMDRYEEHKYAQGVAGNSQAQNFVVATLVPGKGQWEFRVIGRHTLIDGLKVTKIISGVTTDLFVLPSPANGSSDSGYFTVSMITATDSIVVRLNTATGAADTASAVIFGQNLAKL
jgi:hypothetical protein